MKAEIVFFEFYIVGYCAGNDDCFLKIRFQLVVARRKELSIGRCGDNERGDDERNNRNVRTMNSFHIYNYIFATIFDEA